MAKALKATALVVLLVLVWAMPATAHPGHAATSKAVAQLASTSPQGVQQTLVVASLTVGAASICGLVQSGTSAPSGSPQREGGLGRTCCGTMCIVALIELGITPLPLRTPRGIRLVLPPETLSLARAPSLPARPPRTSDIA